MSSHARLVFPFPSPLLPQLAAWGVRSQRHPWALVPALMVTLILLQQWHQQYQQLQEQQERKRACGAHTASPTRRTG
jgi:hypothetical protein